MKKTLLIILVCSLSLTLCACSNIRLGWVAGSGTDHMTARYVLFTGEERSTVDLTDGETLILSYQATVRTGSLTLAVQGPSGSTIWQAQIQDGQEESVDLPVEESGLYQIVVTGSNTGGDFAVSWSKNSES